MCAIFGLLDFKGELTVWERLRMIRALGKASEVRGTDATGIAYVQDGAVRIQKAPRPARRMKFRIPPEAWYIMGHTRMATQGAAGKNYNNHPFAGRAGKLPFALAHNGVLYNDLELRRTHRLPRTKIETDSYVAVQLIEKEGQLNSKSLKTMAEALDGTFTITVLDSRDNLYFVKGNNPLTIYLIPCLGCYVYASTKEILETALQELGLASVPKTAIAISQGDIMQIDRTGRRIVSRFDDTKLSFLDYYGGFGGWRRPIQTSRICKEDSYLEEVVQYGLSRGVPEAELHLLIEAGYDALDLEELLYDPVLRQSCVQEIVCDLGVC